MYLNHKDGFQQPKMPLTPDTLLTVRSLRQILGSLGADPRTDDLYCARCVPPLHAFQRTMHPCNGDEASSRESIDNANVAERESHNAERRVIAAFIQKPQDYFDAAPTFKQSCVIQSGEIFSIFKQIKESFDTNLSDGQKEEMANQKAYEDLKVARSRLDKTK